MKTVKEIAEFLKEKVDFLKENPEFGGSYMSLEGPYEGAWAVVVRWSPGWGEEERDDAIQNPENKDYALEAVIAKIASNDMIEDWEMFSDKEGNVVEGIGIEPTDKTKDGYKHIAEFLLDQYKFIQESENSVNESKTLKESEEKEWGIIFNISNIEEIDNPAFNTSGFEAEDNHVTTMLSANTEEEAKEAFKSYLLDTYKVPEESVEITEVTLQESLTEDSQNWGVVQDVEQKVYKNNPSLKLGFVVTGLTKEEAEKQAKEKNTEKLNSRGIFYHAAEVKEGDKKLKEFMDRSVPLKGIIKEEDEHREDADVDLPTEVSIMLEFLVDEDVLMDTEFAEDLYLDEVISDYLSDEYGFLHFGFDYDVQGDMVYVTNIKWDLSESIKDIKKQSSLTEGAPNFGRSDIINLCSEYYDIDDFEDYANDLREEDPEITDEEIQERTYDLISEYESDASQQVRDALKQNDVEDICSVESGYHQGFQIEFKFDDAQELIDEISYYSDHVEDVKYKLNKKIDGMIKALTESVEEGHLNEFAVAYQFSNGEAGYNLEEDREKTIAKIKETFEKLRTEGLAIIDADPDFERDEEESQSEEEFSEVDDEYGR